MRWSIVAAAALACVAGWFFGGWVGFAAAALVALSFRYSPKSLVAAALLGPVAMALVTLAEHETSEPFIRLFAVLRPRAHELGIALAVVWFGLGLQLWRSGHAESEKRPSPQRRRPIWPLIVLLVVSVAGAALSID